MKRRNLIFLLLPLLLAGCQSYKKVPYLQNDLGQIASADTSTRSMTLYDARIMPKDLLTIVVSCPEEPELAEPFNLTIATPASNTGNRSLTSQPALQQYLVDNAGEIDFPVIGRLQVGGLTKNAAENLIREQQPGSVTVHSVHSNALRDAQKSCIRMISRRNSRVFCELCSQKTPRGMLPVNQWYLDNANNT